MKRLIVLCVFLVLAACNSQKKYSDFDYSFARSGGFSPIYENLWIKGDNAHYSYEGHGKEFKKDFKLSAQELKLIEDALAQNDFRMIQEDYKKIYDNVSTAIYVKKGPESGRKSDASFIMESDKARWDNVVKVFQDIIESKALTASK